MQPAKILDFDLISACCNHWYMQNWSGRGRAWGQPGVLHPCVLTRDLWIGGKSGERPHQCVAAPSLSRQGMGECRFPNCIKPVINGSNLGRFSRDRLGFKPCMDELIVPKSIQWLTWVQPACWIFRIWLLPLAVMTVFAQQGWLPAPLPFEEEHKSSAGWVSPSTPNVLQEIKSYHLWPALNRHCHLAHVWLFP